MEADLGQLNIGLASAWRKAAIREDLRRTVGTATLQRSTLWKKKEIVDKRKPETCRIQRTGKSSSISVSSGSGGARTQSCSDRARNLCTTWAELTSGICSRISLNIACTVLQTWRTGKQNYCGFGDFLLSLPLIRSFSWKQQYTTERRREIEFTQILTSTRLKYSIPKPNKFYTT